MAETTTNDPAFRMFAKINPHEAAEHDWPAFVALCREQCPSITDAEIRDRLDSGEKPKAVEATR